MKRFSGWLMAVVAAALTAYFGQIVSFGLPAPIVLYRALGLRDPEPKRITCTLPEIQAQKMPPGFDAGYSSHPQAWLRIDDDQYCDYCRLVGDPGRHLWCTFGTKDGLVGKTLKADNIDWGYPETAKWVDYLGQGVPAYERVVGDSRDKKFITPVYPDHFGPQIEQPNGH